MSTVVEFALFFVSVFLGIVWFSVFALPLLYGVPRATLWAVRGRIGWRVIPLYLISPIIWLLVFVGAALLLEYFAPNVARHLYSSPVFFWGQWFGIILSALRAVGAASARQALHDDFLDFVRPYLTPQTLRERGERA